MLAQEGYRGLHKGNALYCLISNGLVGSITKSLTGGKKIKIADRRDQGGEGGGGEGGLDVCVCLCVCVCVGGAGRVSLSQGTT